MNPLVILAQAAAENPAAQIARTFGVDWPHLIAQFISFSVVCLVLYRFTYKPVLGILEERRKRIAQGLADAEAGKAELARAEAQRQELLVEANAEANRMLQEAHAAAARVQEQETRKALAAGQQLLLKAQEQAAREHTRMLAQLKRELGTLVVQTTATVTGKVLTPEDQRRLVNETAAHIST